MEPRSFKNILCIRADNMGDVIMSGVAMRALKKTFGARITLLTSRMGAAIAPFLPDVDDVLSADLPWVKAAGTLSPEELSGLAGRMRALRFDLAVIFTVYSQNPLPAALLCWMADIPVRVGYCRENPYRLLTDWIPDEEPYSFIRHQVKRDLALVRYLGADTADERLALVFAREARDRLRNKLRSYGIDADKEWIVLHPGVSEQKREYPLHLWMETASLLSRKTGLTLLVTGAPGEEAAADAICREAGSNAYSLAGRLAMDEFIALISESRVVISVNTVTSHIAAAVGAPVVVLYAMTNPQHTPWMGKGKVLPFPVDRKMWSNNIIIRQVCEALKADELPNLTSAERVVAAVEALLPAYESEGLPWRQQ